MSGRYVIAAGLTGERRARMAGAFRPEDGFAVLINRPGLLVAVEETMHLIELGEAGLIFGSLFTAGRREPVTALSNDMVTTILAGRGDLLVRAYWGNYVALLTDPATGHLDLLRSPLGTLPCLHAPLDNGMIIASDLELLERFGGIERAVDWEAMARFLVSPDLRFAETCRAAVSEVRGGDRLELAGATQSTSTLWSPWQFAQSDRQFDDRDEAARRLRDIIIATMGCATVEAERFVIPLSGGLDSSIVTASAAACKSTLRAVTVSTSVASGDERQFARLTAERAGVPLAERHFSLEGIDLSRSAAANLPRPVARAFEYEGRRQARLEAESFGARTMLSGGGGDNIFCSLQSVAPVTDALDSFDDRREFWRVARELSKFTGASLFTVARRAWLRSQQRRRQAPMPTDWRFLNPGLGERLPLLAHPWLQRPSNVRQGKGAHVAGLLGVQVLTEDANPLDPLPLRFPLLAQPVVELCLRIPTYFWYDRGCNRAVARHAFSAALPAEIAWRRSKGTPDGFVVEIYDALRTEIRSMLLDGELAARGLLDLPALSNVLDDPRPARGTDHGRIMRLVDIEAWIRSI